MANNESEPMPWESDFDAWTEHFKPMPNVGQPTSFEIDGMTRLFNPYGDDLRHVQRVLAERPGCVWTLVESDGCESVTNGFMRVNRVGYFITEVPWEGDGFLDIPVSSPEDFDDDDGEEDGDGGGNFGMDPQ